MIYEFNECKNVVVSGDIHGDFKGLVHRLCIRYGCRNTLLVVAGDCGFGAKGSGYYEMFYKQVANRLRKANNHVVFVRGNHDDPSYFSERKVDHKRWMAVPDYSVLRAAGHDILCVGGAVSPNRRDESVPWWPDEVPVFDPVALAAIPEDVCIDTVVTHTAPSFCELLTTGGVKAWIEEDPSLEADLVSERGVMDAIYREVRERHPLERWLYGHFHQSWNAFIDGVAFTMLDIGEFKEIR